MSTLENGSTLFLILVKSRTLRLASLAQGKKNKIMEIELERTFLLKDIPAGLRKCKSIEIIDIYIPKSVRHPVLRIRKKGDVFEITKKYPLVGKDSSEQGEHSISLTKEEFEGLA